MPIWPCRRRALDKAHGRWRIKPRRGNKGKTGHGYLFSHQALAKVFHAKVLAALAQLGVSVPAFLHRVLRHVLPKCFRRARNHG